MFNFLQKVNYYYMMKSWSVSWSVSRLLKIYSKPFYPISQYILTANAYSNSAPDEDFDYSVESSSNDLCVDFERGIPVSIAEYKAKRRLKPHQPANPHLLKVAILGEPNVGKSTLTNNLVGWRVCSVSKKVHTTREKAAAIMIESNKQIVFLDTPGFVTPEHSKRHHLEASLVIDPERSLLQADLFAVVIDVANKWTRNRINPDLWTLLNDYKQKKSILILNKVDAIKSKRELLDLTEILTDGIIDEVPITAREGKKKDVNSRNKNKELLLEKLFQKTEKHLGLKEPKISVITEDKHSSSVEAQYNKGWPYFSRVFMISALQGEGVGELKEYLLDLARPAEWEYHTSIVTDQNPHDIALMTVREKLLDSLPQEVPYNLVFKIEMWNVDHAGVLRIVISINCSRAKYGGFVIGPGGRQITRFVSEARQALADTFRCEVALKLVVKVKGIKAK